MPLSACTTILLRTVPHDSGSIAFIESGADIKFEIKRVYFLYDIKSGVERGSHAHKTLYQLLVATSGSFDVHLSDGINKLTFTMNRPDIGLLILPMVWRTLDNFSSGSVCMALASQSYDESDYIRDFNCYLQSRNL